MQLIVTSEGFHRVFSWSFPSTVVTMVRHWSRTGILWSWPGRTSTTTCSPSSSVGLQTALSWRPVAWLPICSAYHGCTWKSKGNFHFLIFKFISMKFSYLCLKILFFQKRRYLKRKEKRRKEILQKHEFEFCMMTISVNKIRETSIIRLIFTLKLRFLLLEAFLASTFFFFDNS